MVDSEESSFCLGSVDVAQLFWVNHIKLSCVLCACFMFLLQSGFGSVIKPYNVIIAQWLFAFFGTLEFKSRVSLSSGFSSRFFKHEYDKV